MWEYQHQDTTTATPAHLYRLWADVGTWVHWNQDLVQATLHGPFAADSHIEMTTPDDTIRLRLTDVQQDRQFTDEVEMDGLLIRTVHQLNVRPDGLTQVTYRMQITGTDAAQLGPEIGPAITSDFPDTVAALIRYAEQ
ncbi:hypothetical protein [Deinococcus navajonensis]|uniref:Polyketide cyclase/dehydrase/lipid transport protein n=1 Tax=Deinococcus navajonensis TaxID=309884 RepID=A0ABV8XSI1_9DEIO